MLGNPLEYFQTVEVIRKCKDFLAKVTGFDLEITHIGRKGSFFASPGDDGGEARDEALPEAGATKIDSDILEDIQSSKKPRFFYCPRGRMKVAVPLVLNGEVAGLFIAGENGFSKLDPDKREALSTFLSEIGNYVLESESAFLQQFQGHAGTHKQELLNKVLKYIKGNIHQSKLSLKQVARENGVSYCYLSRLFKNELKTTFVEYRNQIRMYLAAKLLMDLRLTVDQVSRSCGFEDPSYFSKAFKKVYRCSPGSFRRRFIIGKKARSIDALMKRLTATMSRPAVPRSAMSWRALQTL